MTSALHQSIHLFHGYCTVEEILQLRLVSNDLYDVIATCEEVGSRLRYKFTEENKITALRKPFCKINLYLNGVITMDDPRTKSICTSIGKLYIFGYDESSFELKDTSIQNLELEGCYVLQSIVLHPGLKHLKLGNMKINKVSVLQIMSYDLVSLTLDAIEFDKNERLTLDLTTMTNLEEFEIKNRHGIESLSLPSSIKKLSLFSYKGTPIDFKKCTNMKSLVIRESNCFDNHDIDLSTTSITVLTLYRLCTRSLILPTSLQTLVIRECDRISTPIDFKRCTNLKTLEIWQSKCFDNHDIDLSATSLTDLTLYRMSLSSLVLPTSLQTLSIYQCDGISTPIDFQSCPKLKDLHIDTTNCFNNTDLDLSTIPLTDLSLERQSLSSLILPTSLQTLVINDCDDISTPIDFKKCTNLEELYICYSKCFNNTDLDLSILPLTDLWLCSLSLSSLILPTSMQESYMRDPSSIFKECTIPKLMIKNKPEQGCTEDSFTILQGMNNYPCDGW